MSENFYYGNWKNKIISVSKNILQQVQSVQNRVNFSQNTYDRLMYYNNHDQF